MSELESISKFTKIVADTGDFNLIAKYHPTDSTTNPSLIRQVALLPKYKHLLDSAIKNEQNSTDDIEIKVNKIIDQLIVTFGVEILKLIPGKVSIEMDASLSFDTEKMVEKGLHLIDLLKNHGIGPERVYLKLPSTWEGIQAAKILKSKDSRISVNMTLIFSLVQAVACADVGADLISPFVGRITDYFKNVKGMKFEDVEQDPGVINVRKIFNYYEHFSIKTIVMGASFRNIDQIKALCGLPALTISPKLLEELNSRTGDVKPFSYNKERPEKLTVDEKSFRWLMNCDEMASFKLEEGIRLFHNDTELLRKDIMELMKAK